MINAYHIGLSNWMASVLPNRMHQIWFLSFVSKWHPTPSWTVRMPVQWNCHRLRFYSVEWCCILNTELIMAPWGGGGKRGISPIIVPCFRKLPRRYCVSSFRFTYVHNCSKSIVYNLLLDSFLPRQLCIKIATFVLFYSASLMMGMTIIPCGLHVWEYSKCSKNV